MRRRIKLGWLLLGFAAGTLAAAAREVRVAQAQGVRAPDPSMAPGATGPRGRGSEPFPDEGNAAPDLAPAIPSDDPSQDRPELDDLEPRPRAGQRPVVRDGDPSYAQEAPLARDGVIDVGEPEAPQDGVDPTTIDTRPPEDIAVFENPPAGFDPLLFQIEDLDPIRDNRLPGRLFRFEPFDPVGIPVGSFVLFPEVETDLAHFSNVLRSPNARSDIAYEVRPSARLVSNWRRHALEFRSTGTLSFYEDFDSEDERGYLIEARGRVDVTRRTSVQAVVSRELTQESRSAIDARTAGDRANLTTDRATATFNHRFNRLSVQLRGSVNDYDYGAQTDGGVVITNDDRDYVAYEEAIRASWEFKPTLFAFAELAVNQRRYEVAALSDNIRRDSDGERYRVGLSFGNTGRKLRGEVAVGYGTQRPDDRRLAEIDGIIIDANATWRATPLTSLLLTARSDVSETTTTRVGGTMSRQVGVEARHEFRRHVIGSAGLGAIWQSSPDGEIDERELRATLGLEYFLNREVVVFGRYAHTVLESNQPNTDYTNDEIRLGVRLRR